MSPAANAASDANATENTPPLIAAEQLVDSPLRPVPSYADASDHELTRIGARWDELSGAEKQALLKEVKLRMAKRKDRDGVLMIRTQRRYGRVYGGGQYLKIETKVVRIRPAESGSSVAGRGFGAVGFEQRSAEVGTPGPEAPNQPAGDAQDPAQDSFEPPVVRVSDATQ